MKESVILLIAFVFIGVSAVGQTSRQKKADHFFNNFAFVKAVEQYQKMIDNEDNIQYAQRKLGDAYLMLRQPENALSIYKDVVAQENVPSEYYYYYALVLRATGNYKASKKWIKLFRDKGNKDDSRLKEFFNNEDLASGIFNSYERYTLHAMNINTEYNEYGAFDLGDKIVFTSSRDDGVTTKRIYAWDEQPHLDIYITDKENATVVNTAPLEGEVNTPMFHDGSVSFTSDGTTMYFSRNNHKGNKKIKDDEGTGQVGIYTATLKEGYWVNVEPIVLNNPNYLVYNPSVSEDGKQLYFASDMPGGYGGTDIYLATVNEDGSIREAENLGPIVNSEGNESFPFIHSDGVLYFSSDGHVGMGLLDVFATVKDENGVFLNVINLGAPINSKKDDFGYFLDTEGFKGYISSNRFGGIGNDDIYRFNRIPPLRLKGHIFDNANDNPIARAKVILKRKNGEELAYFITEEDGSYEHLIPRDENFILEGAKEKYTSMTKEFNSHGIDEQKEIIVDLNIGLAPIENVELLANLETIYFDLDKSFIRPDAAKELDKVVALMQKYPDMVIRLESHTDSRASDVYNLTLSQNRARLTYKYIVEQGVSKDRITKYEGLGESNLVNNCTDGVKCSEEEHQLNRRTEFIILKMK
ncbi:OmpA family protein [Urechidicola sp. KH5]